jgi:hypothetical protein
MLPADFFCATRIIVIASAAKQSSLSSPHEGRLDCFVALLLAMTGSVRNSIR